MANNDPFYWLNRAIEDGKRHEKGLPAQSLWFELNLSEVNMNWNAAKLVAKLPAAKVRELIRELEKQLGEG